MLANNWSPPRLRLLALEAKEPAEESIKWSLTRYKLNNKLGNYHMPFPYEIGESPTQELCEQRMDYSDDS